MVVAAASKSRCRLQASSAATPALLLRLQGGGREGDGVSSRALEIGTEPVPTLSLPLKGMGLDGIVPSAQAELLFYL